MKIKYLGTGAYEGVPSLFCGCRVCRESIAKGGRNLRTRSQAILNDELLIDFPPDTVVHSHQHKLDWEKIEHCIITHNHSDHLYAEDLIMASKGFSHPHKTFTVHATSSAYNKMDQIVFGMVNKKNWEGLLDYKLISPCEKFSIGNYEILPLPANHSGDPVFYAIKWGNRNMLYAHDTGYFPESAWELLKSGGVFDLVSLDCTGCYSAKYRDGHMCVDVCLEVKERMKKEGMITDETIIVLNHFSHNGGETYDELVEVATPLGLTVSYDGLEIEF